jgi:N-methylhydantoinase B
VIVEGEVDTAETARLRARLAKRSLSHDYGPERRAYEEVFSVEFLDELNTELFQLPASQREARRREVLTQARAHMGRTAE